MLPVYCISTASKLPMFLVSGKVHDHDLRAQTVIAACSVL